MRKVIGIGETVLDIIFKDEQPIGAYPGGSAFNALISLGRSGIDCTFISEAGNDRVGRNVISFLRDNGVNADKVNVFPESKSPISLAFLDQHNDAESLVSGKKLRVIKKASFDDTLITWLNQLLCPLKETM